MKQLAEALKITAELTVEEWNDFGLAVTRMVDVHVNRQEGEGGEEGDGEGERGGVYIDNQQVTEDRYAQRRSIYHQQVTESECEREFILQSTGREKYGWEGDSGGRWKGGGDGCVLTYTQHTHMSIGNRKHTRILYARAMVG